MILSEYLDNAFPENKLTPSDPYINAQQKLLIEPFSKVMANYMKVSHKDLTAVPHLEETFEFFEKKLTTTFFGGINLISR
jgi:hypothetical protein